MYQLSAFFRQYSHVVECLGKQMPEQCVQCYNGSHLKRLLAVIYSNKPINQIEFLQQTHSESLCKEGQSSLKLVANN